MKVLKTEYKFKEKLIGIAACSGEAFICGGKGKVW